MIDGTTASHTVCASLTFIVFGHALCSFEWIADVEGKSGVGKTRRSVFDQVDGMRTGQVGQIEMLAVDDDILAIKRNGADESWREEEQGGQRGEEGLRPHGVEKRMR